AWSARRAWATTAALKSLSLCPSGPIAPVSSPPCPASRTTVPVNARTFRTETVWPQGVPTSQPSAEAPSTGTTTPVGVAAAPRYEDGSVGAAVEDGRTGGAGTAAPGATAAIGRSCANSTGPRQPAATAASARRNEARVILTASFWLREPQR